eukprot:9478250-Pyramimonas_sp.AAC.1
MFIIITNSRRRSQLGEAPLVVTLHMARVSSELSYETGSNWKIVVSTYAPKHSHRAVPATRVPPHTHTWVITCTSVFECCLDHDSPRSR